MSFFTLKSIALLSMHHGNGQGVTRSGVFFIAPVHEMQGQKAEKVGEQD